MTRFVAASWPAFDDTAAMRARRLADVIERQAPGWTILVNLPGFLAAEWRHRPGPAAVTLGEGQAVLFGDLFDRAATDADQVGPARLNGIERLAPRAFAEALIQGCWGSYVAILRGPGSALHVVRDPIGGLDCLSWRCDTITIVASHLPDWLPEIATPALGINWDLVPNFLVAAPAVAEDIALDGVEAIRPGSLTTFHRGGMEREQLWHPVAFASRPHPGNARELEACVDRCIAAWASLYGAAPAELSGGLDSAIVAASLDRAGTAPSPAFHYFTQDREGDERCFARSISEALGLQLVEIERDRQAISAADLAGLADGVRPGLTGMDVHYDRDLGRRLRQLGANALFTGQGGDAIFFQMPTPTVAADLHACAGFRRKLDLAIGIARWTRVPIWTVLGTAISRRATALAVSPAPAFLGRQPVARQSFWLEGSESVSPAKAIQIWGLANSRLYFVPSYRDQSARLLHPLMSQPLVELALSIPVIDLTHARRDRALAREAFADRLPQEVVRRRGKGDLTSYYGRLVAASLDTLRPLLLDGLLAGQGIIDRSALEPMLDAEAIAWQDAHVELLTAAIVETWARRWQARADASRGVSDPMGTDICTA
ncbi:asparagine synthase [Sphingomonas sp. DBB INV C78]|uniref:asparagine synthase-related protein n=1 Tax=Sphingomonas sp. DBB INV C78 TaxID=3349434 RepID=UPI0036D3CD68